MRITEEMILKGHMDIPTPFTYGENAFSHKEYIPVIIPFSVSIDFRPANVHCVTTRVEAMRVA